MPKRFRKATLALLAALAAAAALFAANHREAPITALDRAADITDFFAFRSYQPGQEDKVTFILNTDPLLEPSNGPNYFPFDPDILYAIRIDNNHDAFEDIVFEFRFKTEIRLPGVFTGFVGAGDGVTAPSNAPLDLNGNSPVGQLVVPPAITALDGPGSEGLSLRQSYSITLARKVDGRTQRTVLSEGRQLFAVPSNVGPRTMPSYPALAAQGIYDLGEGIRAFAGTVDDPFYIDLGAAFDSLNFRVAVLDPFEDGLDDRNIRDAADDVSGFNVNSIAIEVPIDLVTNGEGIPNAGEPRATIGAWGTTSRPNVRVLNRNRSPFVPPHLLFRNNFVQIQRMGNPLINELIIGTGSKDKFSMAHPRNDAQFEGFALDPVLARVLNAVFGIDVPDAPRLDLLPLVQYMPPIAAQGTPSGPIADLLRVNLGVAPTPFGMADRRGLLGGDPAGFPNGRRVFDDVVDISARAVAGVLNPDFNVEPNNLIGDGVNTNDRPCQNRFPYVAFANSGRESRHVDPGEN